LFAGEGDPDLVSFLSKVGFSAPATLVKIYGSTQFGTYGGFAEVLLGLLIRHLG